MLPQSAQPRPPDPAHRVVVREDGACFEVVISPPPSGVQAFSSQAAALRYAETLARAMGWEVIDLLGGSR